MDDAGSLTTTEQDHAARMASVAPLVIEAGKYYVNRRGDKVGPMLRRASDHFPWAGLCESGLATYYRVDGSYMGGDQEHPHDLISEYVEKLSLKGGAFYTDRLGNKRGPMFLIAGMSANYPFAADTDEGRLCWTVHGAYYIDRSGQGRPCDFDLITEVAGNVMTAIENADDATFEINTGMTADPFPADIATDADGWITWNGEGECPVEAGARIEITIEGHDFVTDSAHTLRWSWICNGGGGDITRFRLVNDPPVPVDTYEAVTTNPEPVPELTCGIEAAAPVDGQEYSRLLNVLRGAHDAARDHARRRNLTMPFEDQDIMLNSVEGNLFNALEKIVEGHRHFDEDKLIDAIVFLAASVMIIRRDAEMTF